MTSTALRLALVVMLGWSAPAAAQDAADLLGGGAEEEEAAEAEAAPVEAVPDAEIAARIRAILEEIEGYDAVVPTVRSGIVTLEGEILDADGRGRLIELVERTPGVVAVQDDMVETTDLAKRLSPAVARLRERAAQAVSYLPLVAVAAAVAGLVILAGFALARLRQPWDRLAPNAFIAEIYRQCLRLVFAIAGVVVALDILGATALLGTILGAAGIIGLAIGFAVRDTVENFIASVMLSIRQPFGPGDEIEIEGDRGKVARLTSRATILLDFDGNHRRIPNAIVFKSRLVNYSRNPRRRFSFRLGVEAESDLAAVRDLIEATVAALPFTLDQPGIDVWIEDITDAGVVFSVTGWIDQRRTSHLRARGETLRMVKQAVEAGGYAIPDTTYRIRVDGGAGGLRGVVTETDGEGETPEGGAGRRRARPVPPPPSLEAISAAVETKDDAAVAEMIAEERDDPCAPDLLRADAPKE